MQTKMGMIRLLAGAWALAATGVQAAPVVYSLQTVGDGRLGNHAFTEARITIELVSDTALVESAPSGSGTRFVNRFGIARVTIVEQGRSAVAVFEPGEVYVFYDTGTGTAGFGSPAISPTYPVALDCSNTENGSPPYTADCTRGNAANNELDGTLSGLILASSDLTPELLALPKTLSQPTLLTGRAHMCATTYTIGNPANTIEDQGNLGTCSAPAARGLRTDRGGFYLQDMVGGSNPGVGPFGWGGWDTANFGYLQVTVLQ